MFFDLVTVIHTLFVSLGVGASTLAVVNFFVAIWDGKIDENERRMMGVVYKVLRVGMVALLFLTLTLSVLLYTQGESITKYLIEVWVLLCILYINAALMTFCKMPSAFGPAIQASAWYILGIITAIRVVEWGFSVYGFVLSYVTLCLFFISLFNLIMMYCKECQKQKGVCIPQ